jgi:hypothetical protein
MRFFPGADTDKVFPLHTFMSQAFVPQQGFEELPENNPTDSYLKTHSLDF